MSKIAPQCQNLREQVNQLIELLRQEPTLRSQQDTSIVETALGKALSPRFEIVFAGAFSAGKSMLINALLERELLYSAEGHATGTECHIEYSNSNEERVVLTFLSEAEIRQQALVLTKYLDVNVGDFNINQPEAVKIINQYCQKIIAEEGGENKSERAKQGNALHLLLMGFEQNRERIHTVQNSTYSMDQLNFSSLAEAAGYARRGANSAVLKRLDYFCHHPLLQDGNVLVDLPGIDAPVKEDAERAYRKIESPDTSAVVCVLKPAAAGDMSAEETQLLERISKNTGIRDRVFYVFNRIDDTWYNTQLRQRLESLIQSQFRDSSKVYKTSGLLGFYGSQVKQTNSSNRFGLDSIFADNIKSLGGEEETPQFVSEFNNYCANSGKLLSTSFRVSVNGYETSNENYVRILSEWGTPLIDQLIHDSGIESFRSGIGRYLAEEKYPELFATLANDLQPLCIALRQFYLENYRELDSQPREIAAMKAQELTLLNQEMQNLGIEFKKYMSDQVNDVVIGTDREFDQDFTKLKARMVARLDELLKTFSVMNAYKRATESHPRNSTAPFIAVLVEALYYLANELEDAFIESINELVKNFFQRLGDRLRKVDCYHQVYRLVGNDGGIEQLLRRAEADITKALVNEARTECDRYVRESPRFYDEGTFSIYQFRQTLQQTSQGYDAQAIVEAEPAIKELLKLDFEPKVFNTVRRNFRQTVNNTLKTHLLPMAEEQAQIILEQYDVARKYREQTLEQDAEEKIARNSRLQSEIKQKIDEYQTSILSINECLKTMQISYQLPIISSSDLSNFTSDMVEIEDEDMLD
ncbi:dynamin-like GTPase family protein [Synechocystis sp. FACHB-383]|uniref:dynamin-like GTPase family protein n=1 Tax=Synechocystis sp. FACHB-383 TaxID=2692864 RepID=UPI00168523C8|nr:dynamin-like GTPase family protein [Synechocystis sp. FACHB-383]MBD2654848.1 dynamin-like GTPase family protein [Synechocystis sp. FACHB-383]